MDPYVVDLDHLAFVIAHDGFGTTGGCSCPICARLRVKIAAVRRGAAMREVCYCSRPTPHPAHTWGGIPTQFCPGMPATMGEGGNR